MQNQTEEKLFYRFRSTQALLGENQELENEEIYFAPAKDLNDPLEGYMDIGFKGDQILWNNFFRNYLFCLCAFRTILTLTGDSKELTDLDIHTGFNSALKVVSSTGSHNYKMACDKVFSNSTIQKIIDYFSTRSETVSQDELLLFLQYIHIYLLDIFVEIDVKQGLMKQPIDALLKQSEKHLEILSKLIDLALKDINDYSCIENILKYLNTSNDCFLYLRKIQYINSSNIAEKNFQLLLNYPKCYINNLSEIMYPQPCITCFSQNYKDLSMWGYYADSSKGVCLMYKPNIKDDHFCIPLKVPYRGTSGFTDMELKPVLYKAQKPLTPFFRSLGRLPLPMLEQHWYSFNGEKSKLVEDLFDSQKSNEWRRNYWEHMENNTNIKHPSWSHEEEYRIALIPIFDADYDTPEKRKIKYNFQNLYGIIFGVNTDDNEKLKIIKIIYDKCVKYNREDFKLYQAVYNNNKGEIDIIPMNILKTLKDFENKKLIKCD